MSANQLYAKSSTRLAFRVEGEWWRAYIARSDSMDDAALIGSIALWTVANGIIKRSFVLTMQQAFAEWIHASTGQHPLRFEEHPAPEHERSVRGAC